MATSWVGGIGIVTLFSMLIPNTAEKSVLTSVEISGMASDNGGGGKRLFVQHMFIVYVAITAITAVALKLAGMGWFDAVANAMLDLWILYKECEHSSLPKPAYRIYHHHCDDTRCAQFQLALCQYAQRQPRKGV